LPAAPAPSQPRAIPADPPTDAATIASIHRLILRDGTEQPVRRWLIRGDRVRFISSLRAGQWEELPTELVDWTATERFAREHSAEGSGAADARALDAEAAAERAEMGARTPSVLPDLSLPDRDGVWALDFYHGAPELVTLAQNADDLAEASGHAVQPAAIRPVPRRAEIRLSGAASRVRLHEADPAFYVSLSGGDQEAGPDAITVKTPDMKGPAAESSPDSSYVIVAVEQRRDARVIPHGVLGEIGAPGPDVTPMTSALLPGRHWMKLVPTQRLASGEYALVEVLGPHAINTAVWDFAIDPRAGDNPNAILPMRRGPEP
jgi:hypothetical protein